MTKTIAVFFISLALFGQQAETGTTHKADSNKLLAVVVEHGGTGATNAQQARINLNAARRFYIARPPKAPAGSPGMQCDPGTWAIITELRDQVKVLTEIVQDLAAQSSAP